MKKVKHHKLPADQRPLFGVMHTIQKSKKDKLNSRRKIKEDIKKELQKNIED